MLTELEFAFRGFESSPRARLNFWNIMGRLISIGLPVVPRESHDFEREVLELIDALPPVSPGIWEQFWFTDMTPFGEHARRAEHFYWATRWHSLGCPAITLESNLAASLMATEPAAELIDEVNPPWDCFVVRLPRDIVELGQLKFTHLVVHRYIRTHDLHWRNGVPIPRHLRAEADKFDEFLMRKWGYVWGLFGSTDEDVRMLQTDFPPVLLGNEKPEYLFPSMQDPSDTPPARLVRALTRLVVGISCMAENAKALRPKSTKTQQHQRWRFSKVPLTTEYVLAPDVPVKFDCTEAVGAYLRGERKGPPRIQYVVRGHWRNQVHGKGRASRKRIWIQPHWKGPEDAPRLFREHRLEGKPEDAK